MFALILLISAQGLSVFMLPNAVPNTMHAQTDRQTERQNCRSHCSKTTV